MTAAPGSVSPDQRLSIVRSCRKHKAVHSQNRSIINLVRFIYQSPPGWHGPLMGLSGWVSSALLAWDFRAKDVADFEGLQRGPCAEQPLAEERLERKIRPAEYLGADRGIHMSHVLRVATDGILELTVVAVAHALDRRLEKLTNIALIKIGPADEMGLINDRRRQLAQIHTQ